MTFASRQPGAAAVPQEPPAAAPGGELRAPLLQSEKLFQGHRAVEISHNGVLYRLQATRMGKLILTK